MRLTKDQSILYADFAQAAVLVTSEASFRTFIDQHVQPLLPHGKLIAVIGQLNFEHLIALYHVAINYPDEVKDQFVQPINIRERPVLQRWLHTRQPVVVCPIADSELMSEREHFECHTLELGRLAVHGVPDLDNRMGSYFSFAQVSADFDSGSLAHRLSIMIPMLHIALNQARRDHDKCNKEKQELTRIEKELLVWLAAGRSNQEMAALRHRSPATIRNQLVKLYAKLGVSTRAEATSLALSGALLVPMPESDRTNVLLAAT